jgi:glycosyltransferase involved in cell wall biosynthesis
MATAPKKIMHLIATNFHGGPEKQVIEHLKRLDSDRYQGILASYLEAGNPNETLEEAEKAGLKDFGIPTSGGFDFSALVKIIRLLRQERVDLLCTHGYRSTVMGWWAGRRVGIPLVAFSRGYTSENPKVAFYEWVERKFLSRVDGIIFVSEGQRKRVKDFRIRCQRSWVVHNAVAAEASMDSLSEDIRKEVLERLGIPDSAEMVVSAGRLSPEKGHRYLVEAIGLLEKTSNNSHFVFCGDGPCQKELEMRSKELGISQFCHFVGFRKDIKEIFRAMDFMVLPSLTEGLPNVVLEAFACAKPVVSTNVGGVPEIMEDGVNGILVPAERSDLLAKAIKDCLAAPEKRRLMGEAGYNKVRLNFSFESQTEELKSIYREVLNERRHQCRLHRGKPTGEPFLQPQRNP